MKTHHPKAVHPDRLGWILIIAMAAALAAIRHSSQLSANNPVHEIATPRP